MGTVNIGAMELEHPNEHGESQWMPMIQIEINDEHGTRELVYKLDDQAMRLDQAREVCMLTNHALLEAKRNHETYDINGRANELRAELRASSQAKDGEPQ